VCQEEKEECCENGTGEFTPSARRTRGLTLSARRTGGLTPSARGTRGLTPSARQCASKTASGRREPPGGTAPLRSRLRIGGRGSELAIAAQNWRSRLGVSKRGAVWRSRCKVENQKASPLLPAPWRWFGNIAAWSVGQSGAAQALGGCVPSSLQPRPHVGPQARFPGQYQPRTPDAPALPSWSVWRVCCGIKRIVCGKTVIGVSPSFKVGQ
jgi:hypothetical protein